MTRISKSHKSPCLPSLFRHSTALARARGLGLAALADKLYLSSVGYSSHNRFRCGTPHWMAATGEKILLYLAYSLFLSRLRPSKSAWDKCLGVSMALRHPITTSRLRGRSLYLRPTAAHNPPFIANCYLTQAKDLVRSPLAPLVSHCKGLEHNRNYY